MRQPGHAHAASGAMYLRQSLPQWLEANNLEDALPALIGVDERTTLHRAL
jgi:hypothetical protein